MGNCNTSLGIYVQVKTSRMPNHTEDEGEGGGKKKRGGGFGVGQISRRLEFALSPSPPNYDYDSSEDLLMGRYLAVRIFGWINKGWHHTPPVAQ
jgi:hypothetical protein